MLFSLHYVKFDCMVPFDAAIVTHGKDTISSKLTNALSRVQVWLGDLCLIMLNTKKTVSVVFSKQSTKLSRWLFHFLEGVELVLAPHFKILGVALDSELTFKKHIKKVSNTIKFSILNFITTEAAKSYLHCMVLSHLELLIHCLVVHW